jgi:hypothetical protein
VLSGAATNTNVIVFGLTRLRLDPMIYHTQGKHASHYTIVDYQKGCTRLTPGSDKVYQLLAQGRWFSPGTPASSTTKTGRHDIAEILLKVALKHQKSINH